MSKQIHWFFWTHQVKQMCIHRKINQPEFYDPLKKKKGAANIQVTSVKASSAGFANRRTGLKSQFASWTHYSSYLESF